MFARPIPKVKASEVAGRIAKVASKSQLLIARALNSPSRELPNSVREPMGRAFGFDFARVRIHSDAAAAAASRELGARAWTWGEDVVLGPQAQPETLRHELAHVVQQGTARADTQLRPEAPDEALERDAEKASRTLRPPVLAAPSRRLQRQGREAAEPTPLREPRFGGIPGVSPAPFFTEQLEFRLLPEDRQRIDDYLNQHGFGLIQLRPALDGTIVTMDEIVGRLRPLVLPLVERDKIEGYIESKVRAMVLDALLHPHLTIGPSVPTQLTLPLPPSEPARLIQGWQTVLAAGGQIAWHINVATGRPASTPQDTTMQFQAARSFAAHPERESGSELQGLIQFGYNVTSGQVTILTGAQFTEVFSLFSGLLQIGGFAQVLAGVAAGTGSVSGQIQPSIGLQALVQIGPIQFGPQIFQGATLVPGGESTHDTGAVALFQFSF